jgi:formate hydrogenlyase transcriptional activator
MRGSLISVHPFDSQESPAARLDLQHESDRLKLLLDMTNTLVSNLKPRDLLRAISASIRQDMHCDSVGVWLPDSERRQLRQCAMDFPESKGFVKEDMLRPAEGTEIGNVLKTGKAFVLRTKADVFSEWATSAVQAESIESACALPLISRKIRSTVACSVCTARACSL